MRTRFIIIEEIGGKHKRKNGKAISVSSDMKERLCVCTPVEAAENVKTPVLSPIEIHAEDGRKDEQYHGKVKHHHHCSLQEKQKRLFQVKKPKQNCFLSRKRIRLTFFVVANSGKKNTGDHMQCRQ